MDLRSAIPSLLPLAIEWAQAASCEAAEAGVALNDDGERLARRVGVRFPERIRVAVVDALPLPPHPLLRQAALENGVLGPSGAGLTLGHTVFVRRGVESRRLLSHEFRHVFQYEEAGSIAAFLPRYLEQIAEYGYANAPLEIDARDHEVE